MQKEAGNKLPKNIEFNHLKPKLSKWVPELRNKKEQEEAKAQHTRRANERKANQAHRPSNYQYRPKNRPKNRPSITPKIVPNFIDHPKIRPSNCKKNDFRENIFLAIPSLWTISIVF